MMTWMLRLLWYILRDTHRVRFSVLEEKLGIKYHGSIRGARPISPLLTLIQVVCNQSSYRIVGAGCVCRGGRILHTRTFTYSPVIVVMARSGIRGGKFQRSEGHLHTSFHKQDKKVDTRNSRWQATPCKESKDNERHPLRKRGATMNKFN